MMGGGGGGFFDLAPERRANADLESLSEFEDAGSNLNPPAAQGSGIALDFGFPGSADEIQLAQGFGGGGRGAAGPAAPGPGGAAGGMAGGGMRGAGMGGMGMGGGGMAGGIGPVFQTNSLAQVIATTIDSESWEVNGGNGSIVQYHELLVVKNSQTVHGKIKALLEMMRASARENAGDDHEAAPVGDAGAPGAGNGAGAGSLPENAGK